MSINLKKIRFLIKKYPEIKEYKLANWHEDPEYYPHYPVYEYRIDGMCHNILTFDPFLNDCFISTKWHMFHDISKDGKHCIGEECNDYKKVKNEDFLRQFINLSVKNVTPVLEEVKKEKEKYGL